MKIKVIEKDYNDVLAIRRTKRKKPKKPNMFFRMLMRFIASFDLKKTHFKYEKVGMERLAKGENALYLMNHSSFIDLEIIAETLYPKPFNIVTTTDAFIGKEWLLRQIGCIPTRKFVSDPAVVCDIKYAAKKLKSNIVIFPEAGYTFDGKAMMLPPSLGKLVSALGLPLIAIRSYGAFARDPLYNNIQVRDVDVSAKIEYLLSAEEISAMTPDEVDAVIEKQFAFDNFLWQSENGVRIDAPTRADYLHRVLYKCPVCKTEGKMLGKGTEIVCLECGKKHTLTEYGKLESDDGNPSFTHIPDWFSWECEEVRREVAEGKYSFESPVDILMTVNNKKLYSVGEGYLTHSESGFKLTGCDGKLDYEQKPLSSYTANADFNWYEIGDIIGIGNQKAMYYCLPKKEGVSVAKVKLAAEEIYKSLVKQ